MKKLCFLLFILIATQLTAPAQRQANLQLLSVRYGTSPTNLQPMTHLSTINYDGKTEYFFSFVLRNTGPNALLKYDTLRVSLKGKRWYTDQVVVSPGDTLVYTPTGNNVIFPLPANKKLGSRDTVFWCDSVMISADPINGTLMDPDLGNNIFCHYVDANYAWPVGVDDMASGSGELQLYPNPATTSVTLKYAYDGRSSTRITLRNILGVEVYNRLLNNVSGYTSHSIDVSDLPPGLYTAELRCGDRTLSQKFSVQ